jgi:hypothetical protein
LCFSSFFPKWNAAATSGAARKAMAAAAQQKSVSTQLE